MSRTATNWWVESRTSHQERTSSGIASAFKPPEFPPTRRATGRRLLIRKARASTPSSAISPRRASRCSRRSIRAHPISQTVSGPATHRADALDGFGDHQRGDVYPDCRFGDTPDLLSRLGVQSLAEPVRRAAGRVVLDLAHDVIARAGVQVCRLEVMREENDLVAAPRTGPILGGREQGTSQAAPPYRFVHPERYQLAATAPRPAVDAGDDGVVMPSEHRQRLGCFLPGGGDRERGQRVIHGGDVVVGRVILDVGHWAIGGCRSRGRSNHSSARTCSTSARSSK